MNRGWRLLALLWLLALAWPLQSQAAERILDWQSTIEVRPDGWLEVTEHITVNAEHHQIRRGIYRDFPLKRRPGLLNLIKVDFIPVEILRDGEPERWRMERKPDSVRLWIGNPSRMVPKGRHQYLIRYRTWPQLGYFRDFDELYWNVTGNDWAFPIDKASAVVILPRGIPPERIHAEAYTGRKGARGQDYTVHVDTSVKGPRVAFLATRPLAIGEGLTIVTTWPKGFVEEPDTRRWLQLIARSYPELLPMAGGLALLLGYYLVVWYRFGRDLPAGVVHPRYQPPRGHSPASARFLRRMGYDHKTFATALVSLAVKGYLEIEHKTGWGSEWILRRTGKSEVDKSPGEQALVNALFAGGQKEIPLGRSQQSRLKKALKAHEKRLRQDYEKRFFITNRAWALGGIGLSMAIFAVAILMLPGNTKVLGLFATAWLSIWTGAVFAMVASVWRLVRSHSYGQALALGLFSLPFIGGEFFGLFMFSTMLGPAIPLGLLLIVFVNLAFYQWLKAPTRAGRRLLDEIEGFREYLVTAEADDITASKERFEDLGLFERYLPWAMALDVEQAWASHFQGALERSMQEGHGQGWHPGWYHGSGVAGADLAGLSTGLTGGLAGALASASSSGSGGGW
ncbi:MAG: DUF2207 domain-containing protein [Gammaproteobacteria bacterium]|nr:MAG: DUF2207 domain-containing protein [Gammaproteobacteria bacterium]